MIRKASSEREGFGFDASLPLAGFSGVIIARQFGENQKGH
jgi:hypothetical protein